VGVGQENAAQLQRIEIELKRQAEIVEKAEARAKTLETTGTGADANVNSQIRTEQDRIDAALVRVQPAIDEQNKIIDAQTRIYQDQIVKIDQQSAQLQKFIDAKEIAFRNCVASCVIKCFLILLTLSPTDCYFVSTTFFNIH
jgi:hypothetical protein